jgi:hypothetical protein
MLNNSIAQRRFIFSASVFGKISVFFQKKGARILSTVHCFGKIKVAFDYLERVLHLAARRGFAAFNLFFPVNAAIGHPINLNPIENMWSKVKQLLRGRKARTHEAKEWKVNNCGTKMPEDAAKIAVNGEWSFEASRIKIIGTPHYDATDCQFIRFDCTHMAWLWKNGSLSQCKSSVRGKVEHAFLIIKRYFGFAKTVYQ